MTDPSSSIDQGGLRQFRGSARYEIVRTIGRGGFGVVFEAIDRELGGRVALKALQQLTADSLFGLKQEFRALADVSHPNLVALYELAEHQGHWFFTMEYLEGTDLLTHVRPSAPRSQELIVTVELGSDERGSARSDARPSARAPRDDAQNVDVGRLRAALPQLVEGVLALHQRAMLHRDIKQSNVMVTTGGRVVLLDFGLVRAASSHDPLSERALVESTHAQPTTIVGTPEYMSPEQTVGDPLTPASDWYAVGTVLFEALCGRRPFVGSLADVIAARQYRDPPRPSELFADAPPDLEELVVALLQRDPTKRPTGAQIARIVGAQQTVSWSSQPVGVEVFVGRDDALSTLRTALKDCVASARPIVVEVYGSSGVGKTAIVRTFLDDVRKSHDALVLTGRCDERKSVPFKAMDGVIDALSAFLRSRPPEELSALVPQGMEALAQLFPVLAFDTHTAARPVASPPTEALEQSRETAFVALRDLLLRASASRPVVIAVDDLQWGDDDSAALLRAVLTGPDAPNILFVATIRGSPRQAQTPFDPLEFASLDRRVIDARPLDERDSIALALALLTRGPADAQRATRIAREARGNPFFLGELTRFALEHHSPSEPDALTLERVVQERIRALPEDARALLELVALIGQPVPQRVIFEASALGERAYPALRALRAANMVRTADAKELDSVEPYHDRIREGALESLSKESLRARHAALARALEARPAADPGLLAEHLFGAGERERAAHYARAAAQLADRAMAFERAARWYRATLEWGQLQRDERVELLARMAYMRASCGHNGAASEAYLEASKLCDGEARSLELRRNAGVQFFMEGRHDQGVRAMTQVAEALGMTIPASPWILGLGLAKDSAWLRVRGTRFQERPANEVDADTLRRLDLLQHAGLSSGFADSLLSMWCLTRFTRMAFEAGEPVRVGLAMLRYSTTIGVFGPSQEARAIELLRMAEAISSRHEDPYLRGCIDAGYGFVDLMMGRWAQGADRCERALESLATVPGTVWDRDTAASFVIEGLVRQGRLSQAFRKAAHRDRDAREHNFMASMVGNAMRWESLRLVMTDQRAQARRVIDEASAKIPSSRFLFSHFLEILARAQLAVYEGSSRAALRWFRDKWARLERSMMLSAPVFRDGGYGAIASVVLGAARESASRERATLLAECDAWGRKLERERSLYIRARGTALRAGAAAVSGRDRDAITLYRAALDAFEAADMHMHVAASRLAIGIIIGGDEGAALVGRGRALFDAQGVAQPAAFAEIFVPQPTPR